MAKTNKQLQAEIDKHIIEINNLTDTVEILEKGIRGVSKILGLDGIAENTYFNNSDIETIEKAIEKLQGKYEKCFEELSMKCGECEGLVKANETIVKAHNELELDKKDLHKRLIEGLQINIEKVEKIGELENKVDEQFKVITKYEKELEKQDKEIEELKKELDDWRMIPNNQGKQDYAKLELDFIRVAKEKEKLEKENKGLEESIKSLDEICEKRRSDCFKQEKEKEGKDGQITFLTNEIVKLEYKLRDTEKNEELKLKARKLDLIIKLQEENEVIKQDKANLLAELTRQINEKSALRKENKRLKKRRREGRYNPKKVYEKLARGWLCYIPEGDYLPTKVHESLIDAMEEGHRLADRTGNQVYIVGTYCKI